MTKKDVSTTKMPDGLVTKAEDPKLETVGILSEHNISSVLTKRDLDYVERNKLFIDGKIEAIKQILFGLTESIIEGMKNNPYSSLIVDDASARFIGLFVWKVLKAEGANNLPIIFYRRDTGHFAQGLDGNLSIEKHGDLARAGNHPLLISEYSGGGENLTTICKKLSTFQSSATVAVLGTRNMRLNQIVIDAGAKKCLIAPGHDSYDHVWANSSLNGVVSSAGLKFTSLISSYRAEITNFRAEYESTSDALCAQKRVNYSRKRLSDIVEEFLTSRSTNNNV